MAITSKFYTGSVDHVDWAKGAPHVGSTFYGVADQASFEPLIVSGVDRTVRITPGTAWGHGVQDVSDSNIDISIPSTGSTRWDTIVVRRTWATSTTTVVRIGGSGARAIPAGRNTGPGVVDDQPIAMVKVKSGSSVIEDLIDLRVFGGGTGGQQALDKVALQYLDYPGAMVTIGTETFLKGALDADWTKVSNFNGVLLHGAGGTLSGSVTGMVEGKSPFLIQAGSVVNRSDQSGYARVTWDKPFPNGLLTVIGFNGDGFAGPKFRYESAGGTTFGTSGAGNKVDWVYRVIGANDSVVTFTNHRINWIALGF